MTRARKDYDVTPDKLAPEWRARAAELGLSAEAMRELTGVVTPRELREAERAEIVTRLIQPTGLTSQRSTFDRRDLTRAVAEASRAGATLEQLASLSQDVVTHPDVIALAGVRAELIRRRGGRSVAAAGEAPRYTTTEILATEQRLVEGVHGRRGERTGIAHVEAVERALQARPSMGDDQVAMVQRLCLNGTGVAVVVGPPGTGKNIPTASVTER